MSENAPSIPKGHRHLPALGVLPLRHPNGSTHWIPPEKLDATPFLPGGNACRIRDHCWCVCIYVNMQIYMYIYIYSIHMFYHVCWYPKCKNIWYVWVRLLIFIWPFSTHKCTFCDPSMMWSCSLLLKAISDISGHPTLDMLHPTNSNQPKT